MSEEKEDGYRETLTPVKKLKRNYMWIWILANLIVVIFSVAYLASQIADIPEEGRLCLTHPMTYTENRINVMGKYDQPVKCGCFEQENVPVFGYYNVS